LRFNSRICFEAGGWQWWVILLIEAIGEGQTDPASDERIRAGAADRFLRGLVQDPGSGRAHDLHRLDRSVCGDPEAKLHRSLDPLAAGRVRVDLGLLDPAADAAQEVGNTIATPTS
jgi:hypothetical protein